MPENNHIISNSDLILVTGSNGFIGSRVVASLLDAGFTNLKCMVRPSSNLAQLEKTIHAHPEARISIMKGNLQSREDCARAAEGVSVIYHLAAGRGEKSYPDAYMNTVITTRNLLDAVVQAGTLRRLVNISSFSVYANLQSRHGDLLDEASAVDDKPHLAGEAYCYAKVRQEELLSEYVQKYHLPVVTMRPGAVYGPGNKGITARVGIGSFGVFLHLGGSNRIPLSYVENCADAIMLAGVIKGIDGEVFNVVDDDLPRSRTFLRMYKKNVGKFRSIYLPRSVSYFLCYAWEWYSAWSQGQLPPVYNRRSWSKYWKGNTYSNEKLKEYLGWKPRVGFADASARYFAYQKREGSSR